jgi:hypothetical protein
MSLRDRIATAPKRAPRKVTIEDPHYGGEYFVRGLTVGERNRYEASCLKNEGAKGRVFQVVTTERMRERLLALCIVTEDGTREFQETNEDMDKIGAMPACVAEPLFEAAREESGLSEKDVEELKGN